MNLEEYVLAPVGTKFEVKNGLKEVFKIGAYATLYCAKCKGDRNFRFSDYEQAEYNCIGKRLGPERHKYDFCCACGNSLEITLIQPSNNTIVKVGQYPDSIGYDPSVNSKAIQSMTELQKDDYFDAIKSHSRGLDVGAFEYLRRAFVCMVDEAKERFLKENPKEGDSKGNIKDVRNETKEVIKKLTREGELDDIFLEPGFSIVYPLLSDGIHNKSNGECAKYYDVLKEGVELIAQRNYDLQERQKRISTLSKALGRIPSEQEKTKNVGKNT